MERLTNFITPVGMCVTSHNTMKHYHPCIVCRNKAPITNDKSEKFSFCDTCVMKEMFERLKYYEDLEEQGLLLRLLCKVGDCVYSVPSKVNYELNILDGRENDNRVYRQIVKRIIVGEDGWYVLCDKDLEYGTGRTYADNAYGETWFLSSEAAEAKLKELEEYHSTERRIYENLKKIYKTHEISESEEEEE